MKATKKPEEMKELFSPVKNTGNNNKLTDIIKSKEFEFDGSSANKEENFYGTVTKYYDCMDGDFFDKVSQILNSGNEVFVEATSENEENYYCYNVIKSGDCIISKIDEEQSYGNCKTDNYKYCLTGVLVKPLE